MPLVENSAEATTEPEAVRRRLRGKQPAERPVLPLQHPGMPPMTAESLSAAEREERAAADLDTPVMEEDVHFDPTDDNPPPEELPLGDQVKWPVPTEDHESYLYGDDLRQIFETPDMGYPNHDMRHLPGYTTCCR